MNAIDDTVLFIRRLDVTTRMPDQVAELSERASGGLLLETLTGRYVLDRDGRTVFLLIDGRHSVGQVVDSVAAQSGLPEAEVRQAVRELCERLLELGLIEVVASTAGAAVAEQALAE